MSGSQAAARPLLDTRIPIVLFADEWGGIGGTAGYVRMLAQGMVRRGYRVAVICHAGEAMREFHETLQRAGAEVRVIERDGDRSPRGRIAQQRWYVSTIREYRGCVLALMMGYFTRGGGVIVAGKLGGASAIVRADLTPPDHAHGFVERVGLRAKDLLVDSIVVGARENIQLFARDVGRSRTKMRVIHTGIELERFAAGTGRDEVRAELKISDGDVLVGTVSRLDDERKGVRDFVAASLRVAPDCPQARFVVVGDGVLRPELERQAGPLLADGRITFTGWRRDVGPLLAAMDVFVMPSHFEGGPTSVLEAMAMGKAVVSTNVGMVPEVIRAGVDGLVVPPRDVPAMAAAVAELAGDASRRTATGAAALAKARADFSAEVMVDRYLALFAEHAR